MSADADIRRLHLWEIRPVRDLLVAVAAVAVLAFAWLIRGVLGPAFLGLLLAYVADPLYGRLERRWRVRRTYAALALIALTALATLGLVRWLVPVLSEQLASLAERMPDYAKLLGLDAPADAKGRLDALLQQLRDGPKDLLAGVSGATAVAVGAARRVFGVALHAAFALLITPVFFFAFSVRLPAMRRAVVRYLPASKRDRILAVLARMDRSVASFFRGRLIIAGILGALLGLGWMLAGVPYWAILGVLCGVLNIIPYASTVCWPAAVLLKYVDAGGSFAVVPVVVWPSAVFVGANLLENWVLTPMIQSGQTRLSPVAIMVAVFAGGVVGGVLGLLLAVPVASCLKIFAEEVVRPRLRAWAARA